MEADKAIDVISGVEGREESKTDSQAKANTFEYIEEEPEPHLHLKTYLIVVVSPPPCKAILAPHSIANWYYQGRLLCFVCPIDTTGCSRRSKRNTPRIKASISLILV